MPRAPRIQYPGAVYHVMSRGQGGASIVWDDKDRNLYLETLGEVCARCGWSIHAWVLMTNHYHWLLETPEANLVAGMQWFQSTYCTRFRLRHDLRGHVLQGRYKAPVVEPDSDHYFQTISSYIHLNPVRAKSLLGPEDPLDRYGWSSYGAYLSPPSRRPPWLRVDRVLGNLGLEDTRSGRRFYREYMEEEVAVARGDKGPKARDAMKGEWKDLRRGWCFGGATFRERMLEELDGAMGAGTRGSFGGSELRAHDEHEAERWVERSLVALGLEDEDLRALRKTDPRKLAIAWAVRTRTHVTNRWVSERLEMGHEVNASRAVRVTREGTTVELRRLRALLEEALRI